jgi:conjugative relaxase-like TrwC/TraI family protein
MSLAKLSAGSGYRYMLQHTARGDTDQNAERSGPLAGYYAASGYPPGIWLGRGLAGVGGGAGLAAGSQVGEEQMGRLFGAGQDPITGQQLGRAYRPGVSVAGFDATFSTPKSVSVLWALADEPTRQVILDAHHAAVAQVLWLMERDVARTRTGHAGAAVLPVRGVIAAGFDHHDSRAGDPQLHTHLVLANKVQGQDGGWRTLDGAEFYRAAVALSESYDALLAQQITARLGLAWQWRARGAGRNPSHELAAVPQQLIEEFSRRAGQIGQAKDDAVADFVTAHGRAPTSAEVLRIRQQATLGTRTPKHTRPLAEYTTLWRDRAARILGGDPAGWAATVVKQAAGAAPTGPVLTTADVNDRAVADVAATVLAAVEGHRSTWSRWNVTAQAAREIQTRGWQFATPTDLLAVRDRITARALGGSVLLNPPEIAAVPAKWRDPSTARSAFAGREIFTSRAVLHAEARLLAAADDTSAPTAPTGTSAAGGVDAEQAAAATAICGSGRVLDLLVGPAGTGKTATVTAIRAAWVAEHGEDSVIGLAVSAAAAHILQEATGAPAETAAMWLTRYQHADETLQRLAGLQRRRARMRGDTATIDGQIAALRVDFTRSRLRPGSLIVCDEAGMADVHTLDQITDAARRAGAKVLLVGDDHQLAAVGPGGSFGMLATSGGAAVAHLSNIRRFRDPDGSTRAWEADASARLRVGDLAAIDDYTRHGRIRGGDRKTALDGAYDAWKADRAAGMDSLLLAVDNDTVTELNLRAQADRVAAGAVSPGGVALADGTTAGVGDRIVARRNDRTLTTAGPDAARLPAAAAGRGHRAGFVRNGQQFTVTDTHPDGSLTVRTDTRRTLLLPAEYVAQHVQLGYAATIHRAQGATVDTCHVIAAPSMTREALYVGMTRGRAANTAYTITDDGRLDGTDRIGPAPTTMQSAGRVLAAILARGNADGSAHTTMRQLWAQAGSRRQLETEYRQIADAAHRDRTLALLTRLGPGYQPAAPTVGAPAIGQVQIHRLARAIRAGDRYLIDPNMLLPEIARTATTLDTVIEQFEQHVTEAHHRHRGQPAVRTLAGGQVTATIGITDPDTRRALLDREELLDRTQPEPGRALQNRPDHLHATVEHQRARRAGPTRSTGLRR